MIPDGFPYEDGPFGAYADRYAPVSMGGPGAGGPDAGGPGAGGPGAKAP